MALIFFIGFNTPENSFLHISFLRGNPAWEDSITEPWYKQEAWYDYLDELHLSRNDQMIINQDDYCDLREEYERSRRLTLDVTTGFPAKEQRHIMSDYLPGNLVKDVIREIATLDMKDHHITSGSVGLKSILKDEPIPPEIDIFYHKSPEWHYYHLIGEHFLCGSQRYNHIPGHFAMVDKHTVATNAKEYGRYYDTRPDCFEPWQFMPRTYSMSDPEDCEEIIKILAQQKDDEIHWIGKKAHHSHNAEGIYLMSLEEIDNLIKKWNYGEDCADPYEHSPFIVQQYIPNPLLIDGHKFDFRVYMLIASLDPLIVLYHDGFLRLAMDEYDNESTDMSTHITNTQLAKDAAPEGKKQEILDAQMWSFEKFSRYMYSSDMVDDPDWIFNFVKPEMKKNMLHLCRMVYPKMLRHPGVFELYGVDYLFDSELHLWFLEVNRSPAMQATTVEKGKIQERLTKDVIDIESALAYGTSLDEAVENSNFEWVYDGRQAVNARGRGNLESRCI